MSLLDKKFVITECRDCPLYKTNEQFELAGPALRPPGDKPACVLLSRVIVEKYILEGAVDEEEAATGEFNCPGCSGLIKLAATAAVEYHTLQMQTLLAAQRRRQTQKRGALASMLGSFAFFRALDEQGLKIIIASLLMKNFDPGEIIIHRGAPGRNLYIVVSGRVALLNAEEVQFASLGRGEIFGEMSLLHDQPVSASVKALEPVKTFLLPKSDLQQIILKYPFLWPAFNKILAQRLIDTSLSMGPAKAPGLTGRLEEIAAAELFQMIHENGKSGCCTLELAGGKATVIFINGEIVRAAYQGQSGGAAFFSILHEQKGLFQFSAALSEGYTEARPIGGFMKLLMEGLRRIDEGQGIGHRAQGAIS